MTTVDRTQQQLQQHPITHIHALRTYTHAPTDTRVGPDRVQLARNGCLLPSAVRLSLSRYCTHRPHPCTVLTAAQHTPFTHAHPKPWVPLWIRDGLSRRPRAVSILGRCVHLPGLQRLAHKRIANYLLRTTAIYAMALMNSKILTLLKCGVASTRLV